MDKLQLTLAVLAVGLLISGVAVLLVYHTLSLVISGYKDKLARIQSERLNIMEHRETWVELRTGPIRVSAFELEQVRDRERYILSVKSGIAHALAQELVNRTPIYVYMLPDSRYYEVTANVRVLSEERNYKILMGRSFYHNNHMELIKEFNDIKIDTK
ncbi:MAG: hypothetical protein ABJG41_09965 [Cyclobacteriaceae bacterium]